MRTGLVILGIILLVLGGVLYYYPAQSFSAQTNVAPTGESNPVTTSANILIPVEWSYALVIMGGLFLFFGLVMPGPGSSSVQGPRGPRGSQGRIRTRTVQTVRYVRARRRSRRKPLARGTSVTTTTTRTRR